METNFFGQIRVIQAFLPLLRLAKGQHRLLSQSTIVHQTQLSSTTARSSAHFRGPLTLPTLAGLLLAIQRHSLSWCSKWALESLSDALRREVRKFGIRVCVLQ